MLSFLIFIEMQSLKVLNLGFNDISGAILVHLKGSVFAYIASILTLPEPFYSSSSVSTQHLQGFRCL